MSDPIKPEELSALLDGELSPQRQAEVRRALAADPALAAEYARLAELDRDWSAAARQARIAPPIAPPILRDPHKPLPWPLVGGILLLLIAIRFTTKVSIPFPWALAAHTAALAMLLAIVIRLARENAGGDLGGDTRAG